MAESEDESNETSALMEKGDSTSLIPIKVGPYIPGVNSFFYTFSQGLAKLGETAAVQELRMKCKRFAEDDPPTWFSELLATHTDYFDSYISDIAGDREGQATREGRILCHLYNTKLYMIYPYFGIYYIIIAVDESGVNYKNTIDLSSARNIYIADQDGLYYQTVSIDKPQIDRKALARETPTDDSITRCMDHSTDGNENDTDEILINNKRKRVILTGLKQLRCAIIEGNIASVKYIDKFLHDNSCLDKTLIAELYADVGCLTKNYFIILATMYEQVDILYFLLHNTNILYYITKVETEMELEDEERREAFRYAMCSDNYNMLEILYDHWCSSMHWARCNRDNDKDVIRDLQRLSRLLKEARDQCDDRLVQNQQMYVSVHCLIKFTDYQIDGYTELRNLSLNFNYSDNSKKGEAERVRILVLNILRIHEEHSDINNIRLRKTMDDEERSVQSLLADDSSMYIRALLYIMYELYYRKLDFNVSLLLLDKLHNLKQRLKTPDDTYQKLECALYYYIYRVSEDWRLYLPINRDILSTDVVGVHKGIFKFMKAKYDPWKLLNAPVIFFERRHFQKSLRDFKDVLENISIENDIRHEKMSNDEINCLTLLPYMRDDYSLKRIVHYMEAVLSVDMEQDKLSGMLIIERGVQVIGEMFKNSEESFHLSSTTKALLQTTLCIETLKKLEILRTTLSHAEDGQLTERIRIEGTKGDLFKEVKTDLETIIHRITTVIQIYKPIVDKSLINNGFIILLESLRELPDREQFYKEIIKSIFHANNLYNQEIYCMLDANFITTTWYELGFTEQLLSEIGLIGENLQQLALTKNLIKRHMMCVILGTLPKYFEILKNNLKDIKANNKIWNSIKPELTNYENDLSDYPTADNIEKIRNKLRSLKKKGRQIDEELLEKVTLIKDYTHNWESIKEVLRFIIEEVEIFSVFQKDCFENNPFEIKKSRCSRYFYSDIQKSCHDDKAITHVHEFIKMIEYEMNRLLQMYATDTIQESFEPCDFRGIDTMMHLLNVKKAKPNQEATDEYMKKKRGQLFAGLIQRVHLLKITLDYPKNIPLSQHLVRYGSDQIFRIVIEMLLADIMSVFVACKITSPLIKSSNLLRGYNLRNALDHGNPFLEVIGEALDSRDFPTELITWAMTMVDDSAAIEALYTLFNENVEFDTIRSDMLQKMTAEQKKCLRVFKSCKRWQDYLKLIPKSQQEYLQNKCPPEPEIKNECWEKLMVAVKKKELGNVMLYINGVDLDLVDNFGKAALHYAAQKGYIEIMKVLIKNGANVNVPDGKCDKRPLHYATMNGMAAAVNVLLLHRADTTLSDTDEKFAIHYVNKEKHEQIFVQLAQHLTIQMGSIISKLRK